MLLVVSFALGEWVLAIKPANLKQARQMMIFRAEKIGVPWTKEVQALREAKLSPLGESRDWETQLASVQNPQLNYPDYYCRSFHAYEKAISTGKLWVEVALRIHAGIWPDAGAQGDLKLRQSYHSILKAKLLTSRETS